ncbi:undecaprenyldiphospho-muramoylpentapeptide beta-N-acetylglucosaminyltransferase [Pseudoramibacter sp.]|jgi:UDP-N-acetylglucosamine--N-acetylmuramyl-(pentapeptide) pyrophosphoryl-undecaprenol N-acetylglucosamine transferase|uniref:undecaprenyldiphospho-muramoylpentapeptide beta-N-acetylglucosaminyltransferase n=1 Tax=Pseudoramibacter sp. TaxID=2034862 RepID=UPI0025D45373|nr:undecaprenyldiphospho-muramoylpentapeptide beta-N-acetylglucosaminyltransferase [Pseudoramibacter sp.]MCH4072631.1 undecaprenyldiphospho-muramoylpentapeptide beta-N-acetylglucosaminyltransferase [Pseudoramibacter sp.]MCH4106402.1 undecaprenyldiphospho-muramoylpentapeptide beta-N-acetylglucosaminyltransferase [Pseudoramibacter sp.]
MKTVFIAAGGTGGHIYPGLAIASALKKRLPDVKIIFIGSHVGMEKNIVPRYGYPMEFINASGFQRGFVKKVIAAKNLLKSASDSRKLLNRYHPDLVIGTGGFTSGIILREAAKKKIPTLIHEQNAYPGKSNRWAAQKADVVCLTFQEAAQYFPKDKTMLCGNPVRDAFKNVDRPLMRKKMGLKPEDKMILAMGGSQGAAAINQAMQTVMKDLAQQDDIQIYQITGPKQIEKVCAACDQKGIVYDKTYNGPTHCHLIAYSNEMEMLMGAADIMIARSGASSICEMAASGTPSILIPYPYAAGDHQRFNAKAMESAGAAIVIDEEALDGEKLEDLLSTLLNEPSKLQRMAQNARAYAKIDADEKIVDQAMALIQR